MSTFVMFCALIAQGLSVAPNPATRGEPVEVRVGRNGLPLPGVEVTVETPAGGLVPIGLTDAGGRVEWVPSHAGDHAVAAQVDGMRLLVALNVLPDRAGWPFAIGTVPLGLVVLWRLRRGRGRRAP